MDGGLLHRRVSANFEGAGEWYTGVVDSIASLAEGFVGVQFDDGDYDPRCALAHVQVLPELSAREARGAMEAAAPVEALFPDDGASFSFCVMPSERAGNKLARSSQYHDFTP